MSGKEFTLIIRNAYLSHLDNVYDDGIFEDRIKEMIGSIIWKHHIYYSVIVLTLVVLGSLNSTTTLGVYNLRKNSSKHQWMRNLFYRFQNTSKVFLSIPTDELDNHLILAMYLLLQ